MTYSRLSSRFRLLRGLDELPQLFFGCLPDHESAVPIMLQPLDVFNAIESSFQQSLNCTNCRAYLFSNLFDSEASPDLVSFRAKSNIKSSQVAENTLDEAAASVGLMGQVLKSKRPMTVDHTDAIVALNLTVDLDPLEFRLIAVPIMDYRENILGCVEVVVDETRSKAFQKDFGEDFIDPDTLVERYAQRLHSPLEYALGYLNSQFIPPGSRFSSASVNSIS